MSIQIYSDITFVFGPPNGDRYEAIRSYALRNGASFSKAFRDHVESIFVSIKGERLLDDLFSLCFRKKIKINRIYPTYQIRAKPDDRLKKFHLRPEDRFAELPALIIFPPKFTTEAGSELSFPIQFEDAQFVIEAIREAFCFDWVNIFGTYEGEIDFEDVLSEGEKVEFIETANGSWASAYKYKGLYFYFDEVQNLGPFAQYSDVQEKFDEISDHFRNDRLNRVSYHLKKFKPKR
tara:strand:+ start:13 stop:717 length:705 start_codon:yes stop_codon:yes gene_type:complete